MQNIFFLRLIKKEQWQIENTQPCSDGCATGPNVSRAEVSRNKVPF